MGSLKNMSSRSKARIKRCVAYIVCLIQPGLAGFNSMVLDLQRLGNETEAEITSDLDHDQNSSLDRLWSGHMATILEKINRYGCWCYLDYDYGRGKGKPVNELDKICKILQHGYQCIILDVEEDPYFLDGVDLRENFGYLENEEIFKDVSDDIQNMILNQFEELGQPIEESYSYSFDDLNDYNDEKEERETRREEVFNPGELFTEWSQDKGIKKSSYRSKRSSTENEISDDNKCIPWEETYKSVVSYKKEWTEPADIYLACIDANPGAKKCTILSCSVEGHFISLLSDLFMTGYSYDDHYSHTAGSDFDPRIMCKSSHHYENETEDNETGNSVVDSIINHAFRPQSGRVDSKTDTSYQCCGAYPERFPFRPHFGEERGCCGQKTFNKARLQCCNDNVLKYNLYPCD